LLAEEALMGIDNEKTESVRVRLVNSKQVVRTWTQQAGDGNVSNVTQKWSGPCGGNESCEAQVSTVKAGEPVIFPWDLPLRTPLNLGIDVRFADAKNSTVHAELMTYLDCGEDVPYLDIMVADPSTTADSPDTASAVFSAVRCSHKEGRHDRGEEIPIERVTAKLQPMEGCDDSKLSHEFSAPQSIVVGNKARVTMLRKRSYAITMQTTEKCAVSCVNVPFPLYVGWKGEIVVPIGFRSGKTQTLFFKERSEDGCDQPPAGLVVFDDDLNQLDIKDGVYTGTANVSRLSSPSHDITSADNQGTRVFRVTPKVGAHRRLALTTGLEDFLLDVADLMERDAQLVVDVLNGRREKIQTLKPDDDKKVRYLAPGDEPYIFQCVANGQVVGELTHQPLAKK
jgi:hypothetical protein